MPTWKINSLPAAQPVGEISATKKHQLGTCAMAQDADYGIAEFVYCKGVASTEDLDWVVINRDDHSLTRLVADAIGPVGVAHGALTASYYGWVAVKGKVSAQCLTQFADNGQVWATGTAGAVDDASVAGDLVNGARGASATVVDSGVADFEIQYPWVDNNSSAS